MCAPCVVLVINDNLYGLMDPFTLVGFVHWHWCRPYVGFKIKRMKKKEGNKIKSGLNNKMEFMDM